MYLVHLVFLVIYFIAPVEHGAFDYQEAAREAEPSQSPTPLVVGQVRPGAAHSLDFEVDPTDPFGTSFTRLALLEEDQTVFSTQS